MLGQPLDQSVRLRRRDDLPALAGRRADRDRSVEAPARRHGSRCGSARRGRRPSPRSRRRPPTTSATTSRRRRRRTDRSSRPAIANGGAARGPRPRACSQLRELEVELARGGDPERDVVGDAAARSASGSFESGRPKPVMIVGMPLPASAGTIGSVPPERISAGRRPRTRSKASRPSWIALASGGTRPGGDDDQSSTRAPRPSGAASRRSRSSAGRDLLDLLPGREPDREVRDRLDRQHRLLQVRRAALDAVHVERGLGERAEVELLGRARVGRPRALLARARRRPAAARASRRAPPRSAGRSRCRSGSASRPSRAMSPRQRAHERVRGVQRGAAVDAGVQVALAASAA